MVQKQSADFELRIAGKFRLAKRLGSGAFGEIFTGHNIKSNEEVAIKLVRKFLIKGIK